MTQRGFTIIWDGMPVVSMILIRGLESANGDDVVIEVNSQGGLCTAGFEMYSTIKQYEGNVEVHVINACSAATFILCAADKVLMSDAAVVMIHNTQSSWGGGDYRDAQMTADMLREFNESVLNVYEKKPERAGKNCRQ